MSVEGEEKKSFWKTVPDNPNAKYAMWWITAAAISIPLLMTLNKLRKL